MPANNHTRRTYIILAALRSAALGGILPVFALYYRHFGLSLFQIALLAAIFEATILLFEVPTGLWADRVSRRTAIVVSEICLALGGVLFVGLPGFWVFIAAEIIQGIGEACGSGSLEAWIVDELHIGKNRQAAESLFASALRWQTIAMLAGSVLTGMLGAVHLRWVWVPFASLHVGGICLSLTMRETGFVGAKDSPAGPEIGAIIASGVARLRKSAVLKALVGFGLMCAFAEEGIDQFWQVHLSESLHLSAYWFGLVAAVPALVVFLIAPRVIRILGARLSPMVSIALVQLGIAVGIGGWAVCGMVPAVCCLGAVFILVDLKKPLIAAWANQHIDAAHRASMLSFMNMVSSVGEAGAGLAFGYLAMHAGLSAVFLAAAGVSLMAIAFLWFARGSH